MIAVSHPHYYESNTCWRPPPVLPYAEQLTLLEPDGSLPTLGMVPRHLGAGSQGICFLARQAGIVEPVVIKWLWPASQGPQPQPLLEEFLREAGLSELPSHPHVNRTYALLKPQPESGSAAALPPAIVMGRFDQTLHDLLSTLTAPLSFTTAMSIVRQIASGLQYLHALNLVHRDLVPDNIAITVRNSGQPSVPYGEIVAALADLSSLAVDSHPTRLMVMPGEAAYIAPERNGGPPRKRWDIYSFGALIRRLDDACHGQLKPLNELAAACLSAPATRLTINEICQRLEAIEDRTRTGASLPFINKKRQTDTYLVESLQSGLVLGVPSPQELTTERLTYLADNYERGLFQDVVGQTREFVAKSGISERRRLLALTYRAAAFYRLNQAKDALTAMQEAFVLDGGTAAGTANLILCLVAVRQLHTAKDCILEALQKWPEDPRLILIAGLVHAECAERNDALLYLTRACQMQPDSTAAWHVQARLFARCNELARAIACLEQALRRAPRQPAYLNQMGVLLLRQAGSLNGEPEAKLLERAVNYFQAAVDQSQQEVDPDYPDYAFNLAVANMICGRPLRAIEILRYACNEKGFDKRARACLGECYLMTGQWDLAASTQQAALRAGEDDPVVKNNLSVALLAQGKTKQAITTLKQIWDCDVLAGLTGINLGLGLLQLGNAAAALEALSHAEAVGISSWQLHYLKSQALARTRGHADAIAHAEIAASKAAHELLVHQWLLQLYNEQLVSGVNEFLNSLEAALPPLQDDPRIRCQFLGRIRQVIGAYSKVVSDLMLVGTPSPQLLNDVQQQQAAVSEFWRRKCFLESTLRSAQSDTTFGTKAAVETWAAQARSALLGSPAAVPFESLRDELPARQLTSPADETLLVPNETVVSAPLEANEANLDALIFAHENNTSAFKGVRLRLLAAHANLARGFSELRGLAQCDVSHYEHQIRAALHVLMTCDGRALLADDVGLGKTVEAGIVLKEYLVRGEAATCLIIAPSPLVEQWVLEMRNKFALEFVSFSPRWNNERWKREKLVIASVSQLKRPEYRSLVDGKFWDMLIVDEAHHARQPGTRTWHLVNRLAARFRLLLTATPVQNSVRDLHALINLTKPGLLGTYRSFHERFVEIGDAGNRTLKESKLPQLRRLLGSSMVRTRRDQTCIELPKRRLHRRSIALSHKEARLYEDISAYIRRALQSWTNIISDLPLFLVQRELCSCPATAAGTIDKIAAWNNLSATNQSELRHFAQRCRELQEWTKYDALESLVAGRGGEKTIVFTEFVKTAELIASNLNAAGYCTVLATGSEGDITGLLDRFRDHADVLVTTRVGGEGHNLQCAWNVVNFDFPWNPMRIEQRIGRVHRLEQTKPVNIFNMVTANTVEAYVVEVLEKKLRMFEQVVGETLSILGVSADKQSLDAAIQAILRDGNLDAGFARLHEQIDAAWETRTKTSLLIDRLCVHLEPVPETM